MSLSHVTDYVDQVNARLLKEHPECIRQQTEVRLKAIEFAKKHGIAASADAFHVSVKTIYRWKNLFLKGHGKIIYLIPKSKRPKKLRKGIDLFIYERKIIEIRKEHPRMGKAKIYSFLFDFCEEKNIPKISESTVGRIIKKLKERGEIPIKLKQTSKGNLVEVKNKKKMKKDRRKDFTPKKPGDLVQIDTICKFINGIRKYIVTGIDCTTSFAFSYSYSSLSSKIARDFFIKFKKACPFGIRNVQTDNGQEFHKYFDDYLKNDKTIDKHFYNYPRHPQSNGKIERFNKTIQNEFIDDNILLLRENVKEFNIKLMDYLIYYNAERPHHSLINHKENNRQISPIKWYIIHYNKNPRFSQMYWTYTLIFSSN